MHGSEVLRRVPLLSWVLAVLVLSACHKAEGPGPAPGAAVGGELITFPAQHPQLVMIKTAKAEKEQQGWVAVNGRLAWDESRTALVTTPISGRIVALHAELGQRVAAGAPLAMVSAPDLAAAQADFAKASGDLNLAQAQRSRQDDLVKAGVAPLKELQQADADWVRAQAEHDRAKVRLAMLQATGARRDGVLPISSPVSGVVVARNAVLGLEVQPGQPKSSDDALFTVSDPMHLWVILDVQERLVSRIKVGEKVQIGAAALPDLKQFARIEYISDRVDPQTRTVRVRASVDNPERLLKAEMFVTAQVEVEKLAGVRVPSNAVYLQGEQHYAFVETGPGVYLRKPVTAQEAGVNSVHILDGVQEGEKVVVDGSLLLQQLLNTNATAPNAK